jgi:hypothetical protein
LKGVPGIWKLYAITRQGGRPPTLKSPSDQRVPQRGWQLPSHNAGLVTLIRLAGTDSVRQIHLRFSSSVGVTTDPHEGHIYGRRRLAYDRFGP